MKVIFAGGGTGGHINPALSVANYMKEIDDNFEALFIGTKRGLEKKLVPMAGYDIEYIDIEGFDRRNLFNNFRVIKKLISSRKKCRDIIKKFKPDAVVCTGGYVSGPVIMAAHKLNIPSIIHEQNVYPGLTVKGSQRYADYIAVSFLETLNHMDNADKCVVTGNPVREELKNKDYSEARAELGLSDKPFVLVFGGSLGADRINNTIIDIIPKIVNDNKIDLMFGTGERNYEKVMSALGDIKLGDNVKIVPYINNMHTVMAAADLVVSRSGAIASSEIAILKKPSILIPSPNVVRNHQEQNAREFEAKGASVVIVEPELSGDVLYNKINELVLDKQKLKTMGENAKKLAKPDALPLIYDTVMKAVNNKRK